MHQLPSESEEPTCEPDDGDAQRNQNSRHSPHGTDKPQDGRDDR